MKKPLPTMPLDQRTWHCEELDTTFTYRTWTMGEQSILVQVRDEETKQKDRADAIIQIIEACLLKPDDIEVCELPTFVLEMLFLKIYSLSMDNNHSLKFKCTNLVDGEECGRKIGFDIPLDDIKTRTLEGHKNVIELGSGYSLKMRYPCMKMADVKKPEEVTASWVISQFMECIFDEDGEVWSRADYTNEEMMAFMDGLGGNAQEPILKDFFLSAPRIHWSDEAVCPNCGYEHKLNVTSINQLFI